MDILAHALWAGVGCAFLARRVPLARRTVAATLTLAVLPDVPQFVPVLGWVLAGDGGWQALQTLALASPGQEPPLPPLVGLVSHHLHCLAHSALVAGAVSGFAWLTMRSLWLPLLGWWSHIVIDVFTHSADFYPSPVLYPLSYRGFDGIAWNEPWFMLANYGALALLGAWACAGSSRAGGGARTMAAAPPPRRSP